jgi:hypothetical protein
MDKLLDSIPAIFSAREQYHRADALLVGIDAVSTTQRMAEKTSDQFYRAFESVVKNAEKQRE